MNWHLKEYEEVLGELRSAPQGLTQEEAARRLEEYGPNVLEEKKKRSVFAMFLDQFKDFMIIVLLAAAVVSGLIGEAADTIAIIVIVVLNAVIGFVQEYRAERAIAALKKMAAPSALVLRDGEPVAVPASMLVPGDIVILEAGNIVPADLRLIEAARLLSEEAALTGESAPVEKHTRALHEKDLPIGDRRNMAFSSTSVTHGRGRGVVAATGAETEIGRIASLLEEDAEIKTPLQKRLASFGQKLAIAVILISAAVFGIGMLRGEPALLMLLTAISLAVAAIPEALPAVVTISLALGAKRLVRQHALVRKLPAVETLGSITYICSDKTGTLTMNRMAVEEAFIGERLWKTGEKASGGASLEFMRAIALSNDAREGAEGIIGDPTEVALFSYAKEHGFEKKALEEEYPREDEIPFDPERKAMTTVHLLPDGRFMSITKGALEVLLERSVDMLTDDGRKPLDSARLAAGGERMAADGLRVLCVAKRDWASVPEELKAGEVETGLTILGLAGIMDPPRDEAREAIADCKSAGIKPVMITGDHPITARVIAKRLGLMEGDDAKSIMTGRELEKLPMDEFENRVEDIRVYARVAPEQKLKIVRALQDKGEFVAMTGDGVNDAPALKRADIGVAMGITGTDVAKESADMVLTDDNFATIVKSVRDGRRIFDNIRKFIKYTMTSNSGEIWTISLAPFFGLPIPLLPIHILWINLVTDGLPGLALAAERSEKDVMKRPPRHPKESIFAHGLGAHIIWVGLLMGGISILTQALSINTGAAPWQTMVFTVLCLSQIGHVLAIRSDTESLFTMGLFSNKPLLGAALLTFGLQMAVIYVPFLNPIFKTEPLTVLELAATLALSSVVFIAVEFEKLFKRRMRRG
ncbi:MAG: cation-translocating P-type ATPase [Thermodesulfobacteriota bacterium]|nr:MAG: cation-translocating P-type ATPase [Thermodesulfobacteriota bacterium]